MSDTRISLMKLLDILEYLSLCCMRQSEYEVYIHRYPLVTMYCEFDSIECLYDTLLVVSMYYLECIVIETLNAYRYTIDTK